MKDSRHIGGPRIARCAALVTTLLLSALVPAWAHGDGGGAVVDFSAVAERVESGLAETEGVDAKAFKAYGRIHKRLDKPSLKGLADDLAKLAAVSKECEKTLSGDGELLGARDLALTEGRDALDDADGDLIEFTGLLTEDRDRDRILRAAAGARGLRIKGDLKREDGNLPATLKLWRKSALKFTKADALARKLREKALKGDPEWDVPLQDVGGALLSVWGESGPAPSLWVVGADDGNGGTFLQLAHAGEAWVRLPVSYNEDLWWVSTVPGDGVWACGTGGVVLRWDPVRGVMTDRSTGVDVTLFGLWGSGPSDVWVVGGDPDGVNGVPVILHWDGELWTAADLPEELDGKMLYKVWGNAPDDVWTCGQGGNLAHWDGSSWSMVPSGTPSTLLTVHGSDSMVAVGGGGVSAVIVERGSTGTWTAVPAPQATPALNGVFVPPGGEAVAVGFTRTVLHRTDTGWAALPGVPATARDLHGVWIDSEGNAIMAGGNLFSLETGTLVTYGRRTLPTEVVPYASFKDVVADVLYLNCAISGCHLAPFLNEGLDFTTPQATLDTTVGVASRQASLPRVSEGRPSRSYLWHKIAGTQAGVGGSGDRMPQGEDPLDAAQMDAIRAWILAGAPDDR